MVDNNILSYVLQDEILPENCVMNYYGRKISRKRLYKMVDAVADALEELDINKNYKLYLCMLPIPEFIYLVYAAEKLELECIILDRDSTEEDLNNKMYVNEPGIVFADEVVVEKVFNATQGTKIRKCVEISLAESMPCLKAFKYKIKNLNLKKSLVAIRWKDFIRISRRFY